MISLARSDQGVRKARKETDPDFGFGRGQLNGRYNAWLHTRLWNELIEDVVAWYAFPNVGGVTVAGNGDGGWLQPKRSARSVARTHLAIRSATIQPKRIKVIYERDSLLCESDKRGQRRSDCGRANDREPQHPGAA
jgi:hypothetical protein